MSEQSDKSVPEAVDRVMNQLSHDNTQGALNQIQAEMNKPGMATESNKQFLTQLTQRCQEQGYLPKLAVDFGKSNFNTLDLDNNGRVTPGELHKILNEPKLRDGLNPFQREMTAYLLQNGKEIREAAKELGRNDLTKYRLDEYEKYQDTKYQNFAAGRDALNTLVNTKAFDVVDKDKDGFLTKDEMNKHIDFAERVLAQPGLQGEARKALEEQAHALNAIKERFTKFSLSDRNDTIWDGYVSRQDIRNYASEHANPRNEQHVPKIEDGTVGGANRDTGVDASSKFTSDVMAKYFAYHAKELDLNSNGKVSREELDKVMENPEWRKSFSPDQQKIIQEIRNRFDDIASWGEISHNNMAEWNRTQAQAREDEKLSAEAVKYMNSNFKNLDKDKNEWLSSSELDSQIDFLQRSIGTNTALDPKQSAKDLEVLEYVKAHRSEISSAWVGSDTAAGDFQKHAEAKQGKLADTFESSEPRREVNQNQPGARPTGEARPGDGNNNSVPPRRDTTNSVRPFDQTVEPIEEQARAAEEDDYPMCGDEPRESAGASRPSDTTNQRRRETPEDDGCEGDVCSTESNRYQRRRDERENTRRDNEVRQESRPQEAVNSRPTPTEKQENQNDRADKDPMEKYVNQYFRYNQDNYHAAMQDALEQHKPIVIVAASRSDTKAIHAGAQAAADGKSIVVFVDKDKIDTNSPLGKYAAENLKNHNTTDNAKDKSFIAVFDVKQEGGSIKEGAHTKMIYGNSASVKDEVRDYIKNTFDKPQQRRTDIWKTEDQDALRKTIYPESNDAPTRINPPHRQGYDRPKKAGISRGVTYELV